MSGGVFAVSRGIFDHPLFADEPLTEREAWIWLISEAAWKERTVRAGGHVVTLKRGQCAHSIRFMAEAWGWSKSRVDRFLTRLENGTMIGTECGTGVNKITICKYDEYQKVSLPSGTARGTTVGTEPGQQRDKLEDPENKEISEAKASESAIGFDEVRAAYPQRDGDDPAEPARKAYTQALKRGATPEVLLTEARAYAARNPERTRFIPRLSTWLTEDRWKADATRSDVQVAGVVPSVRIRKGDVRFRACEERFIRENGKRPFCIPSKEDSEPGGYFPLEWPETVISPAVAAA